MIGSDLLRSLSIQLAVESDDAAECGSGIRRVGQFVGIQRRVGDRHAARVGVLDDHACGLIESLDQFPCRIGIADIVIAQLFTLQLCVVGDAAWQ